MPSSVEERTELRIMPQRSQPRATDETVCVHGAYRSDFRNGAIAVPIYQTAAYEFTTPRETADVFACRIDGNTYSRIMNPTTDILEQRIALLDGGAGALAVASGQAAISTAILNLTMVATMSARPIWWRHVAALPHYARSAGIEVRFVDPADPKISGALRMRARCFFGDAPNPKLIPFLVEEVANIGAELGIPLIVDKHGSQPARGARAALTVFRDQVHLRHAHSGGVIVDNGVFD